MSSLRLHPATEDQVLEDSFRTLFPSLASPLPDEATDPAPPHGHSPLPAEIGELLRVAVESYHLSRFGNHTDPELEPLADYCAQLATIKDLPLESTIALEQVGFERVSVKVHAYRISEAASLAQLFGEQAREYRDAAYSYGLSQAVGLDQDRWFLYIAVLTASSTMR
ncbi:hypothetical protein [Corynebacterium sp. A21]|uniref:hypothetical protein n=1 Tax=Corynebacterium sp. A21 TaxID=3457318 RepID=UPI003FD02121